MKLLLKSSVWKLHHPSGLYLTLFGQQTIMWWFDKSEYIWTKLPRQSPFHLTTAHSIWDTPSTFKLPNHFLTQRELIKTST